MPAAILAHMAAVNAQLDAKLIRGSEIKSDPSVTPAAPATPTAPAALSLEKLNAVLAAALDVKTQSERAVVNLADHISAGRFEIDRILEGENVNRDWLKSFRNSLDALGDVALTAIKATNFVARLQYEIAVQQSVQTQPQTTPTPSEKEN